jgi:hypothetical protein
VTQSGQFSVASARTKCSSDHNLVKIAGPQPAGLTITCRLSPVSALLRDGALAHFVHQLLFALTSFCLYALLCAKRCSVSVSPHPARCRKRVRARTTGSTTTGAVNLCLFEKSSSCEKFLGLAGEADDARGSSAWQISAPAA